MRAFGILLEHDSDAMAGPDLGARVVGLGGKVVWRCEDRMIDTPFQPPKTDEPRRYRISVAGPCRV